MTADRPLSLLVCGCGRVVERLYGPAFRISRAVRLAGVVDPRADRRAWAEQALRVPAFPSLEAALAAVTPDGVVVTTPPAQLVATARAAQRAGLPVLVEKPGARGEAEAESLLAWDDGPPVRLALSRRYWRRYQPHDDPHRVVKATGWAIEMMRNSRRWRAIEASGQGTTWDLIEDMLPHAYDIATSVLHRDLVDVFSTSVDSDGTTIGFHGGLIRLREGPAWSERVVDKDLWLESRDWQLHAGVVGKARGFIAGAGRTLLARAGLRPLEPVAAIATLLDDFATDVRLRRQNDDLRALGALFDQVRAKLEAT